MKVTTAAEMRLMDEKTIKECGLPGVVLMESAGRGAAVLARERFGDPSGRRLAIVAGRGNNGGDGLVMARVFAGWGAEVRVFLLGSRDRVGGDARINLDVALKMGLEVVEILKEADLARMDLAAADLVVDAILGTGLSAEVEGLYRAAIERINAAGRPVVAVDLPSGVDADTGRILGAAVRADLTVTFGFPKVGHFLPPGEARVGRLEVVDIGIPPHVVAEVGPKIELLVEDSLKGLLPPRPVDSHKGRYGHVLIVAGSTGKTGAAALAALAAARSGAGLVTLAVPASLNVILEQKVTEVMTEPLPEAEPGFLAPQAAERVLELCEGKNVLAVGPGLSTRPGAARTVQDLVVSSDLPLVLDADGLNALAGSTELLKKVRHGAVLTPHPGEMARLTGQTAAAIQADRLAAASGFAAAHGVFLVLKGYRTAIGAPDGRLFLNTTGGPHLASGGMGDLLTGMVAGLAAQGLTLLDAARLAVYVHGLAADEAARAKGGVGLLASDVLSWLPGLWGRFTA